MYRGNGYRFLWVALIVIGFVALAAMMPGHDMVVRGPGFGWGFGFFGMLVRTMFWVLLVWLAFSFFWRRRRWDREYYDQREPQTSDPSLDILKRRYAAGEITREQFEEMRRTLEASSV